MVEGVVFTIEPVILEGVAEAKGWDDGWTYSTVDGKRAAQHEETIIVTRLGADILTVPSQ